MLSILFASQNSGKLREIQQVMQDLPVVILSPADLPGPQASEVKRLDVAETAPDFAGNALLKARAFAEQTGQITLADDSGLELVAKPGFPGVASHRWHPGTDADRNQALLQLMKNWPDRRARFVTVLCLYWPTSQKVFYFTGEIRGKIAEKVHGEAGFGYDPLFIPEGYQNSFAELGLAVKNQISHRSRALQQLKHFLATNQVGKEALEKN